MFQISVAFVAQELIELLLVGAMRTLDRAVQLGRARFAVHVTDPVVGNVPVEECLELRAPVRADGAHAKRERSNHVVDEGAGELWRVAAVDSQRLAPGRISDGRGRVETYTPIARAQQSQARHVHLHTVPRHMLLVAVGVHGPPTDPIREPLESVAA